MKSNKIIINLSKDTPPETLSALNSVLRTEKPTKGKQSNLYILNEDIEELNKRYEELFKQIKNSINLSETQIATECEILNQKYLFEIELISKKREIDYEIELANIKARRNELKPWRGGAWRRLFFLPTTNRAQDIIDERAEQEADKIHTTAENAIDDEYKRLEDEDKARKAKQKKPSKRELRRQKRQARKALKKAIKEADNADLNEALTEPSDVQQTQENATTAAPMGERENVQESPQSNGQLPGQIRLDEVQAIPTGARRARPPRSCRKPS